MSGDYSEVVEIVRIRHQKSLGEIRDKINQVLPANQGYVLMIFDNAESLSNELSWSSSNSARDVKLICRAVADAIE